MYIVEVVVMQRHFIIKGISHVIREPGAQDVNDELRALDVWIRGTKLGAIWRASWKEEK